MANGSQASDDNGRTLFTFRYQRECAEISEWLQSALERLEFWNTQAVIVPQELETVRDHLSAFLVRLNYCCLDL